MPTSIQQEAFLFSHAIGRRLPQVSRRLMELMLLESQELLDPVTLNEVIVLLRSVPDLLEQFGRLFLPGNTALEVWTNLKGQPHCMLVEGNQIRKLCALNVANPTGAASTSGAAIGRLAAGAMASPCEVRSASPAVQSKKRLPNRPSPLGGDRSLVYPIQQRAVSPSPSLPAAKKRKVSLGNYDGSKERPPSIVNATSVGGSKNSQRKRKLRRKQDYDCQSNHGNKDYGMEESVNDDQRFITALDTHKSMDSRKSIPDDVSAITTVTHQKVKKRKRGRPKKTRECRQIDLALGFVNDLTVNELLAVSREARIPSTGNRKKLSTRLLQHFSIDCMVPFSALPLYMQKYASRT